MMILLVWTSKEACMKESSAVLVDFEEGHLIRGKLFSIFFVSLTVEKMRLQPST